MPVALFPFPKRTEMPATTTMEAGEKKKKSINKYMHEWKYTLNSKATC